MKTTTILALGLLLLLAPVAANEVPQAPESETEEDDGSPDCPVIQQGARPTDISIHPDCL